MDDEIPSSPGTQKHVLRVLAEYCNADAWCWPSLPRIAAEAGISVRSVQHAVMALEKRGLIETRYVPGAKGVNYRLRLDVMKMLAQPRQPSREELLTAIHEEISADTRRDLQVEDYVQHGITPEMMAAPDSQPELTERWLKETDVPVGTTCTDEPRDSVCFSGGTDVQKSRMVKSPDCPDDQAPAWQVVRAAYEAEVRRKHSVRAGEYDERPGCWALHVELAGRLAEEQRAPLDLAALALERAYVEHHGLGDGKLAAQCHPPSWLGANRGPVLVDARKRLRSLLAERRHAALHASSDGGAPPPSGVYLSPAERWRVEYGERAQAGAGAEFAALVPAVMRKLSAGPRTERSAA